MATISGCIRHVRPFLSQRQWSSLCMALRLPPLAAFGNECERLCALTDDRPASSAAAATIPEPLPLGCFTKNGAYLLDKRHLHVSLPWRETGQLPVDGYQAAQLLTRVFDGTRNSLESIHVHIRIPASGVSDLLQAVTQMVAWNAATLETLSVTCEVVSHAVQLSSLAQHQRDSGRESGRESGRSSPPEYAASAPSSMQDRSRRIESQFTDPVICSSFDLRSCFLPNLIYLNLSVPVVADEMTHFAKLSSISLKFLGVEDMYLWCRGQPGKEEVAQQLYRDQTQSYNMLLRQSCCSLETVHISGDLQTRREHCLFSFCSFLPRLRALSLGWTCEEELRRLLETLRPTTTTLRDILSASQQQPTLYESFRLACNELRWNDDVALAASLSDPTVAVRVPPKLPALCRLSFSGPVRMGLSNLHLDLYTLVNKSSGRGVHFQYGLFAANARRVIQFRVDFRIHPFFALYRDLHSRLHHMHIKGIAEDDPPVPFSFKHSRLRRAVVEPATNDWNALLKYTYVNPSTSSRQLHRLTQRTDFRMQRLMSGSAPPPPEEWRSDSPPPLVGPEMSAYDLFRLEMWHLPVVCQRDFGDSDQATTLWKSYLTDEDRQAWEVSLAAYKVARMHPGPLSFDSIRPWWQNVRQ
eukprot:Gregarina_sp_Poly_1__9689@NODE_614_length_7136_cov_56_931815_g470_i0_p1_GENE_NODE_614_length_7136_cov_56_931815_g470_i0NODE_614_length_7136_cov_56_931815_g470_i0_p1_ORF_typecomplete_len639_score66_46_NODE_614_length_7136_cov_56_931815_g470_i020643980